MSLPPELLVQIFGYLTPKDVCSVSETCSAFNELLRKTKLYKRSKNGYKWVKGGYMEVIRTDNMEACKYLLERNIQPSAKEVMLCISEGSVDLIKLLVPNGHICLKDNLRRRVLFYRRN